MTARDYIRASITLNFTTTTDPGQLLTTLLKHMPADLISVLAGTNTYAFDPNAYTDETRAFVVLDPDEKTMKIHLDDEDAAISHAKSIGGLLIELPVTEDHRAPVKEA